MHEKDVGTYAATFQSKNLLVLFLWSTSCRLSASLKKCIQEKSLKMQHESMKDLPCKETA